MHLTDGILRKTRVLKDLSDDCLQLLASKLIPVVIGIGQDICRQGEIADRIWVLQSGISPILLFHRNSARWNRILMMEM